MKTALALLLILITAAAQATDYRRMPYRGTSNAQATASSGSKSAATANPSAAAAIGDVTVNAGAGLPSGSYSDDDSFYVLPAPVFTPPLPAINSPCTNTAQQAFSIGWSAFSQASGGTNTDNCVAIEMYNAALKACRYATAGQIMDLLTAKVLAGFQVPPRSGLLDLTPAECGALAAPPAPKVSTYVAVGDRPVAAECGPVPVKKTKTASPVGAGCAK